MALSEWLVKEGRLKRRLQSLCDDLLTAEATQCQTLQNPKHVLEILQNKRD